MKRISSLSGLMKAVKTKNAVMCPGSHAFRGPIPAAWVVNLSGAILYRLINNGLYYYERKEIKK
jgi:hypothetical protein